MAFDGRVYRVLVASPADVGEERSVIPEVINDWNAMSAFQAKSILMPVKWESHSAPMLGGRPQQIINEQLVNDCDLLVGVFWTRIGTNTGAAVSGTAEEIELFIEMKKPVMLYFSQSPVDPGKIDIAQFSAMRTFEEKMRVKGLTETYSGIPDFRQKFSRQLGINLNSLLQPQIHAEPPAAVRRGAKKGLPPPPTPLKLVPAGKEASLGPHEPLSKQQIDEFALKAVTATAREDGWANVAAIGNYLKTYTPVDYRQLGFERLIWFLEATGLFEIKAEQKSAKAQAVDSASVRVKQRA